ncbi:hypothetical protein V8J82_22045 [Gymnodinialimonas sp. 2305UL16-5]|uniref:hypothetical protein n=1 Tax=Gymnodinialimonas mytili TaxID=3126503 RepID=UPI003096BDFE
MSHEELDKEVSTFDLTTPDGLLCFLQMQATVLKTLALHPISQMSIDMVNDLLERVGSDLLQLECSDRERLLDLDTLNPISIDYVVAGSRLGTLVLKKRWLSAKSLTVRRATAYFSTPGYIETWAAFCVTAEDMAATGPLADQIVRDTDRVFQFYRECARAPQTRHGAVHA